MAIDPAEILQQEEPIDRFFPTQDRMPRARQMALDIYGQPIEYDQQRLTQLENRYRRLSPTQALAGGSPAIPGNPYSIDTRNLVTGLSRAATGLINREREARVFGDERRSQSALQKADALKQQRMTTEPGGQLVLPTTGGGMQLQLPDQQIEGPMSRREARLRGRAERYGGFAQELSGLRSAQASEAERQKNVSGFVARQGEEQLKAEGQRTTDIGRANVQMARDIVNNEAAMNRLSQQGQQAIAQINQRFENDKKLKEIENQVSKSAGITPSMLTGLTQGLRMNSGILDALEKKQLDVISDRYSSQEQRDIAEQELLSIRSQRQQVQKGILDIYAGTGLFTQDQINSYLIAMGLEPQSYQPAPNRAGQLPGINTSLNQSDFRPPMSVPTTNWDEDFWE
jgi:hypothetical protein